MAIHRTTLQSQLTRTVKYATSTRTKLGKAEEQAMSGLKVRRPSDLTEGAWTEVHATAAGIEDMQTYLDNAEYADSLLFKAEDAMANAAEILVQAKEIAVAAANDPMNTALRTGMAAQIDELREQLIGEANADYNGRYLFAGENYEVEPFDDLGTYLGNNEIPEALVGSDQWLPTGFDGSLVFQGGIDVFQTLQDLSDALAADDSDLVAAQLDALTDSHDQVVNWRQRLGLMTQNSQDAQDVATKTQELMRGRIAELTEADPVEAYTAITNLQTVYDATLQISASVSQNHLFDFIR